MVRRLILLVLAAFAIASSVSAQTPTTSAGKPVERPISYCQSLLSGGPEAQALEQACDFSLSLAQHMPNFTCEMKVEKFEDINSAFRSTVALQKIQARARYVNGKDSYDDLHINGRATQDSSALMEGAWSFGEFGIKLLAAFAPKDHPAFRYSGSDRVGGTDAYQYDFRVEHKANLIWRWIWGSRSTLPGYAGKIWVTKNGGRILRLQLGSTNGVPEDFPIRSVESKTEYKYVDFRDGSGFVLPSKVQITTWMNDKRVIRTRINFAKCQRFKVDSRILLAPPSE